MEQISGSALADEHSDISKPVTPCQLSFSCTAHSNSAAAAFKISYFE